ncbi:hypothetical protein [Pararobbsia alpina]|uniref:hypothetical protein n=1 Tax=Pararobbsia alpina TaxID=621374 RepID=UPI0039A5BA22
MQTRQTRGFASLRDQLSKQLNEADQAIQQLSEAVEGHRTYVKFLYRLGCVNLCAEALALDVFTYELSRWQSIRERTLELLTRASYDS